MLDTDMALAALVNGNALIAQQMAARHAMNDPVIAMFSVNF
jgi:hypothetical protein